MKYVTTIKDKTYEIEIQKDGSLLVNGEPRNVDFLTLGPSLYSVIMENQSYELVIETHDAGIQVQMRGHLYTGEVLDERAQLMAMQRGSQVADSGEINIKSPMPGLIVALPFGEGEQVAAGQTIIILESMKMQNELKAPRDGVISRVHVQTGQSVEQNTVLISLT